MTTAERFSVDYLITVRDDRSIDEHAHDITIEQTVEVPEDVIPRSHHELGLIGQIESILQTEQPEVFAVTISYRCDVTAFTVPQLLNVLFGNISLKNNIRIIGLDLPAGLRTALGGPRYGGNGLRQLLGVFGRPLACTAIKPMGLPVAELAQIAGDYALGGADLIKDDHGITDQPFHRFDERIARCQEAVQEANARTGRNALYFPMLAGRFDQIDAQARMALRHGIRGVLVGPLLVGCDTVRHLSQQYGLAVMAHPALTGTFFHDRSHGIAPAVLLGTLFRLIGADISIFPNAGGRFHFSHGECRALAEALQKPLPGIAAALPGPAGGMRLEKLPELCDSFGKESVFLIGGDVLRQKDRVAATRAFVDGIRAIYGEERRIAESEPVSACEWPGAKQDEGTLQEVLHCRDYHWHNRQPIDYKMNQTLPFAGVARHELIGRYGEQTAFDLRYFEIAPGGYTSLEKHVHEHVVIGVRGQGLLKMDGRELPVGLHDVAYVAPLKPHQLHNPGNEPFGFFCIVDRDRDRPQPV